jgi:hypothetical protein
VAGREAAQAASAISGTRILRIMKTFVYVDGFNLYYGSLKGSPYKWLDLNKLCQLLLPQHTIVHIRYFTALVKARPSDPQQPARQQAYLRALKTLPNVTIHLGAFLSHPVRMAAVHPPPATVEVIKTEEKGSDVNLASWLLIDAFTNQFETAAIITNDSDLKLPIDYVINTLQKPGYILNPQKRPSQELLKIKPRFVQIRQGVLGASQFPDTLTDSKGTFNKPATW